MLVGIVHRWPASVSVGGLSLGSSGNLNSKPHDSLILIYFPSRFCADRKQSIRVINKVLTPRSLHYWSSGLLPKFNPMRIGHMFELKSEFWQEKAKSKTEALNTGLHGLGPAIRMYPTWYP